MDLEKSLKNALVELRKEKERKFDQSVDLLINLQKFDNKKTPLNIFVFLPHKVKEKKICAFLESKNKNLETITREEFKKYSSKGELKRLVKRFDFFVSQASLMANVATVFGRFLGPAGKMPSPQLGILTNVNDREIENLKERINKSARIRTKEASIKLSIGKQSMKDEEIAENASALYGAVLKALPKGKENIKSVEIKFTMTKPVRIREDEKENSQ